MKAQDHPQYHHEQQRLTTTLGYIKERLFRDTQPTGGDDWANQSLGSIEYAYRQRLREALQCAYFGRVDVQEDDGLKAYYIGKHLLNDCPPDEWVYSWKSPQVGEWFYLGSKDRRLKRAFDIDRADLRDILDEFVHSDLLIEAEENEFTDSLLHRLLSENRTGRLHDIVATIQEQQYRLIQSPADQLLVIQGAAGSGKSSIALHRLAYLLFNDQNRFKRTIVLGPSRMFMEYIARILPTLGEHNIPQKTVDELLLDVLGTPVQYTTMDASIEMLLSDNTSNDEKLAHYRLVQLKGSLRMATLLERYVQTLSAVPDAGSKPLDCHVRKASPLTGHEFTASTRRTAKDIAVLVDRYRALPVNKMRHRVKEQLIADISGELYSTLLIAMDEARAWDRSDNRKAEALKRDLENTVRLTVNRYLREWSRVRAVRAYRQLLREPELLADVGKHVWEDTDLTLLGSEAKTDHKSLHFCDLPALVYLKLLLDGTDSPHGSMTYDHIVLDEAQDISPMHFKVLSRLMHRTSMTVLGDLAQGVYTHAGINAWADVEKATGQKIQQETIRQSYRSTQQITEFANTVLNRSGTNQASLPQPIARIGPSPSIQGYGSQHDLCLAIRDLSDQELASGHSIVAVICKTAAACEDLARQLSAIGVRDCHLLGSRNASLIPGVCIIPSYLAKGLEFDSVIVADADEHTYPPDNLSAKLLYVALTRATHTLHVRWVGVPTPLLDNAKQLLMSAPSLRGQQRTLHNREGYTGSRPSEESPIAAENAARYEIRSDALARMDNAGHYGTHVFARQKDGRYFSDIVADDYSEESEA